MGNAKCTSFISIKNYWGNQGPDTEKKFMETLSPELLDMYRRLAPNQWFSITQTLDLEEAMAKFIFPEEPEATNLCKLGSFMAKLDLNGLTKLLLKVTSVAYAVQQATVIWHSYHDQGEPFVQQHGKNHLRFLVFDYPDLPPRYSMVLAGWIQGLLEICGAKHTKVTLRQAIPHIAFDIRWK
jgi:hypothetical protein